LIDFADTFQTTEIEIINNASNYFRALLIFLKHAGNFGLLDQQVLDYFGEPDHWDSTCGITPIDGGESIVLEAPPLFPYISAA